MYRVTKMKQSDILQEYSVNLYVFIEIIYGSSYCSIKYYGLIYSSNNKSVRNTYAIFWRFFFEELKFVVNTIESLGTQIVKQLEWVPEQRTIDQSSWKVDEKSWI